LEGVQSQLEDFKHQVENLRQATGPEPRSPEDPAARFRELLRSFGRLSRRSDFDVDLREKAQRRHAQAEFDQVQVYRLENPPLFGRCLAAYYQTLVDTVTPACTPAQREALRQILETGAAEFSKVEGDSTADRILAQIRLEGELHRKVTETLSEHQNQDLCENGLCSLFEISTIQGYWGFSGTGGGPAGYWAKALGTDPIQFEEITKAAIKFEQEAWRAQAQVTQTGSAVYGTPEYFAVRENSMRAQVEALRRLSPFLTTEQQARLKSLPIQEFLFLKYPDEK
jgi:hypothetical protein